MMTELAALPLPEAQDVLVAAARPVGTEIVRTDAALGRVLAQDIVTPRAFPDTRRSAVDGYALSQSGLQSYRVVETIGAGELPQQQLGSGEAAAVMTGATVPDGSVAVIRVEDTELDGGILTTHRAVECGDNINFIGEEMAAESSILSAGMRLTAVNHSVLCCTGIADVEVYRLPQVGILITGDEVLQLGRQHKPGSVYDSNRHFLSGCLTQLGIQCQVLGPVNDDEVTIRSSLDQLAAECDLVISSGGVSMGKYDFIRPLLHSSGFDVLVNRTGIKPGRPLIVACRDQTLFFGMPGYPAACLVNFFYYLLPTVKRLLGLNQVKPQTRKVVLAADLKGKRGRWDVIRVKLEHECGEERVRRLSSQMTSHFLHFGQCDGLVLLEGDVDFAPAGSKVDFLDFEAQF